MSGCDVLYRRFFVPWYRLPPGQSVPRITKGDLEIYSGAEGTSAASQCRLPGDRVPQLAVNLGKMIDAARSDWPTYLDVGDPVSVEGLDAFDKHWSRAELANLIRRSDPSDFTNDYLVVTCELGAVVGEVMRVIRPELEWLYRSPYWESSLWHSPSATLIPVFHWAIKRMSAYGAGDGLRQKVLAGLVQLEVER